MTHTPSASATWYVVNEGENAWGIGYKAKEDRSLIVQKAIIDYVNRSKDNNFKTKYGFPNLPGFPGYEEVDQEIVEIVKEQARQIDNVIPEELFEI
jgi:hypothetical protein